jgi:hypothetical protein
MVLSGYGKNAALNAAVDQGDIFKVIAKPWKLRGNFEKLVQSAVEQYDLQNKHEAVRQKH